MKFLYTRRITIAMIFLALTMLGVISYEQLAMELLPNAEYPTLSVRVSTRTEMDPSYIESQAVQSIEGAIKGIEGIEDITTVINSTGGTITVSFKKSVNFKYASIKLQEKIREISSSLPEGFSATVQKSGNSRTTNSFITLQVRGTGGVDRVRTITDDKIIDELESIDGVASVNVFGGRERSIEIRFDNEACLAHNLTPSSISRVISGNTQDRTFIGNVSHYNKNYYVHTEAAYEDVSDLEYLVVAQGPIYLKDVADIFYDYKEETSYNRVDGKEAISINLANESQKNIIDISNRVINVVDKLNEELRPYDVDIVIASNTAKIMEDNLEQIAWLALIGGLLAVVILWLFLKNIRLVLIIALSMPISVITAFNLFYAFGITINSLTLVGMALAIGMLLDNSIVVLENIYRLYGAGHNAEYSVAQGTKEVWRSIFAATLTTITVFLPFIFSSNDIIKLIGYQIGVSIISTLAISLFVAFLFIPMAAYVILKYKGSQNSFYEKISIRQRPIQIYLVLLKMTMRNTFLVFISALVLLFIFMQLAVSNKNVANQSAKTDRFSINFSMRQGTTLEAADDFIRLIEDRLEEIPEKKELIVYVTAEEAAITFVLQDDYEKIGKRSLADIKNDVQGRLWIQNAPGWSWLGNDFSGNEGGQSAVSALSRMLSMMGIGSRNQNIIIKGLDFNTMQLVGEDLKYYLSQMDFISNSGLSYAGSRPEVHVNPDQIMTNSYEITKNNISEGLSSLNKQNSSGSSFKTKDKEYDIVISEKMPEAVTPEQEEQQNLPKDMNDLEEVLVEDANGGLHSLKDIASIKKTWGQPEIRKYNGDKQLYLYYQFNISDDAPKDLVEAYQSEVEQLIADYPVPAGVALEIQEEEDQFADFKFLMFAALLLIFMILASVFESVVTPFVLLFTIPLAAIGSLFVIYLTDNSLTNTNTLIGFLILLGVVVNNGIILIDYTNILRHRGFRRNRALVTAGLSRVRPILITSITTIVALFPMALGKSEYSGLIGAPFAITVIGGLFCSSLLTLIVIPSVYMGLEKSLEWYRGLSNKIKVIHLVVFALGIWLISRFGDGILYQMLYLIILAVLIPGATYFFMNSLKRASKKVIAEDEPITIKIENLVKIYDRPSLFEREWLGGIKLRKRINEISFFRTPFAHSMPYWIIPLLLCWWQGWTTTSFIVFFSLSGVALLIRLSANYVYDNNIDIRKIEGKYSGTKSKYFSIVTSIPLLGKKHRPFKALKGVSFEISNGMFGLLGPNGAGKSTFIRIISGILEQSYGTIWINGMNTREHREELQGIIGYLPQEFGTYESMSAYSFLDYQAILKGITDKKTREERLEYVLKSVHMYDRKDHKIGSFSGGMKQRIGIALILLHLPRILVVDEPTAGLDPRERIRFRNLLVELSKERIVIFSTHIIEDISSSCNQVVVINKGELRYFGTPNEMLQFADSLVWSFTVSPEEFELYLDPKLVVLHIQDGDKINVRYISETKPWKDAVRVEANLEDAYLCLLKNMKNNSND